MATKAKFEVLMRLRAIELIAYWEGKLNTAQIIKHFGVSRQQASTDIKLYVTEYNPNVLEYSPELKGYFPNKQFKPVLTNGHINEYMEMLSGLVAQTIPITLIPEPHIASVHLPDRAVKPDIVRQLIQACRKQQALKITYASMNKPTPHERILSPHSLIYSGFRWHVRGYSHEREDYRDFVISRISKIKAQEQAGYIGSEQDNQWHEEVELNIVPNQHLSPAQQTLIANDFAMKKGVLILKVKKALVHYTLQRYQVAINENEKRACQKYPLQLHSGDVEHLLFREV
jgi:predicted DNA-binding transcriptional regulator YafY